MRRHQMTLVVWVMVAASATVSGYGQAAENVGTVRQPLVGGTVISDAKQEEFGLLSLEGDGGSCSASLLRNNWAVTAAHCVEVDDDKGNPIVDPDRPGQNKVAASNTFSLTASWKTSQTRTGVQVATFRPYDVAIIRVDIPFVVRGSAKGYSRLIFQDGQFPYFGDPVSVPIMAFGRGIFQFATGSGATAMPSQRDGLFRVGYFKTTRLESNTHYWYPSADGQMMAGGDSGGPSFAWILSGWALIGVHSAAHSERMPGKPKAGWDWVTSTSESADAPIAPVWDEMLTIMGPAPPAPPEPSLDPPPPGFIGTFAKTPPGYQPLWIYGIRPNGVLVWYRKDTSATAWQGPKDAGYGWNGLKDVIAAGGNSFYALTTDNKVNWYQHNGFNDGSFQWNGPVEVGSGWTYSRIFAGGEGIVYAIRDDGKLLWLKNQGANFGARAWSETKEIGSDWGNYKDVFSTGRGHVFVVKSDGTLWLYLQKDYANGSKDWYTPKQVATGWGDFQQIIPAGQDASGGDVILAITKSGKLLWNKYGAEPSKAAAPGYRQLGRVKSRWEGPVEIGSGWQDFGKVIALMPVATLQGPR